MTKIAERRAVLEQQRQDIAIILDELAGVEKRCAERLAGLEGPDLNAPDLNTQGLATGGAAP